MANYIQNLSEFKLPKGFRGRSAISVQCWWLIQSTLFAWSPQFMYSWRNKLLRAFGAKIGEGVIIRPSVRVTYPWRLTVGDYSWIGDDVVLYTLGDIHIGSNSVISQKSYLCAGAHDYNVPTFDIYSDSIVVEDEVWLATDVFVAPGVRVKRGAVVGARSSVFKDVEPESINYGNPCRKTSQRVMKG